MSLCKEMLTFEPVRMVNMKEALQHEVEESGLKTLELSNLDIIYDFYNSVALFYDVKGASNIDSIDNPASKLQSGLEELLLHYPAAAGRLHMNDATGRYEIKYKLPSSASCAKSSLMDDDYGLPFIVARANTTLSGLGDVTNPHPSLELLYPSLPIRDHNNHPPPPVIAIQVTMFTCGSFALALMSSHTWMDAYSIAIFLKNLCSITKGEGIVVDQMEMKNRREVVKPRVPASPKASQPHICTWKRGEAHVKKELPNRETIRFAFSKASLEALRQRASYSNASLCSRYKAIAALFWVIRAKWLAKSSASPCTLELPLRFPINVRERKSSICNQSYTGNAIIQFTVLATLQELCESSLACVAQKITSSVADMHIDDYVQSEIDYIELQLQNGRVPCIDGLVRHICLPCLAGLPFYDTDCGWGRPIYCARPCRELDQRIIIMDDPQSNAWNVLLAVTSQAERDLFAEEIAKCISAPV